MWKSRSLLTLCNSLDFSKKLSCGSGVLLASVLLVNQSQDEKKKSWTVEYPTKARSDVTLSRKVNKYLIFAVNHKCVVGASFFLNFFRNFFFKNLQKYLKLQRPFSFTSFGGPLRKNFTFKRKLHICGYYRFRGFS